MTTSTISRTWRRITIQIQYLSRKHPHWCRSSHAAEYDRTPSQRIFTIDDDDCSSCSDE
ncbi:hypothetical protein RO3G_00102 [Rhizopus delemar RA 99-880]|uniref:Uncharacterized protein n=1 Tax=Rhizopus delemar (strain RA 99-880 / ATCC MYA-4621 / FGSC 9543 / NRRL 43880) TaxID=246409 RepID=I1BGR8_RHIO9|nr:hypothetical protein RO3G_00102 [Rhizopus delemar RA 99-880]|eukprot:EIE75398.1 hypothetical protein RO3G_00102 [Rhizopus delemar RA 99-880]